MLKAIIEDLDGDKWEEICDKCYRMRYQDQGFTKVPPKYLGDSGIEGFTATGIVYQCYYPEKEYSDDDLYDKQRDKLTKDIGKLMKNEEGLKKLGVGIIKEWHFVIPEYRDRRIVEHCETKRKEVMEKKLNYIDDNFRILIKIEEDFLEEINRVILYEDGVKLNISYKHTGDIDLTQYSSEKVDNIQRKIQAIIGQDICNEIQSMRLERITKVYVSYYSQGIIILNQLRSGAPELYEKIKSIEQVYKLEAQTKCDMNWDKTINKQLFDEILKEFGERLNESFSKVLTIESIQELKNDLISGWLADCPMDFYR